MKNFSFLLFVFVLGFSFAGCQRKDDVVVAPDELAVSITSPVAGQVFAGSAKVPIRAMVAYPSELHGYQVTVQDAVSGETFFDFDEHLHSDHFSIDTVWPPALSKTTMLKATFTIAIDHEGKQESREVLFSIKL